MTGARPIFIIGSGRSGTAALAKFLKAAPGVAVHHEYLCTHIQPLAVRYAMGRADADEVRAGLKAWHGTAIHLSNGPVWGDSSNKLSWIVPFLAEVFPEARIAHVVRDGRKVASSFLHKLASECYDDSSVAALASWLDGAGPMPPPEKRYWWPIPQRDNPWHEAFAGFDQFQRIAFHWTEINRTIMDAAEALPDGMLQRFRLEDLVSDENALHGLCDFLGVPYGKGDLMALRRPHNVNRPEDVPLSPAERDQFDAIAGPMMQKLGYDRQPEYRVDYNPVALVAETCCTLCGSADLRAAYRARSTARDLTVHVCFGCGLVQSLPRRATAPKQAARVSGGADWGNVRYGKGFRLADTMRAIGNRSPRRILDIGSNRGAFVRAARETWPDAKIAAIEPDNRVVGEYVTMPGVSLHTAPVEDIALQSDRYDLIHCSHTLEHLADPMRVMEQISAALTPDGIAYLEVPNIDTIRGDDLVEEWFIDKHLYHFDPDTFSAALARAKLAPVGGISASIHLAATVTRGEWARPQAGADPVGVTERISAYDLTLAGNQQALAEAARTIAAWSETRNVAIWGAGRILDSLVRIGGLDLAVVRAVLDRHLVEHADRLHGAQLLAPEALRDLDVDLIIIASREFAAEIAAEAASIAPGAETMSYSALLTRGKISRSASTIG